MKKLIKQYLTLCIKTKKGLNKEIERLDKLIIQLYELLADQQVLIEEFRQESYKTKYQEEHKKFKNYQKDAKEIIDRYESTIKDLQKEVK